MRVGRDDPRELGAVAVYVGGDVEQRVAADDGAQLIALEGREARRGAVGHDARTEVDRARGVEDLAPVLAAELEPLHEEARPPKLAPETSTFRENSCAVTAPNLKLADHLVVAVGDADPRLSLEGGAEAGDGERVEDHRVSVWVVQHERRGMTSIDAARGTDPRSSWNRRSAHTGPP